MSAVNIANIPAELHELKCWQAHVDKKPCDEQGVPLMAWQQPENCLTLDNAIARASKLTGALVGIGIVFSASGDIRGLDLDGPRNPTTGEVHPDAAGIITGVHSYTEVTPSGTGFRVLFRAPADYVAKYKREDVGWTHPTPGKKAAIEVFVGQNFCTITGDHVPGTPSTIELRPEALTHPRIVRAGVKPPVPATRDHGSRNTTRDVREALKVLDGLRPTRADDRDDWLRVGMMLHSVSPELLPAWVQWTGAKHRCHGDPCGRTDEHMAAAWRGFHDKDSGITLASGIMWAHEDARSRGADKPVVRSMADFIADPERLKPPPAVIPRLAWAGRIVMTAGASGTGKSTIYKAGCAAVTRGHDFLGAATVQDGGDVLWARLEESEYDLFVNGLQRFKPDPARLIAFRPGSNPLAELVTLIRSRQWAVTVVDSIHQLLLDCGIKDFNDAAQVGTVFAPLEAACRDTGTAMVWIGKANREGKFRNSSEFEHTPDLVWEVSRAKDTTTIKFDRGKTRFDIFDFKAELVDNREYRVVLGESGGAPGRLSKEQRKVLAALVGRMEWTAWRTAYGGNPNTFKDAQAELAKRGLVTLDAERGTWTRVEFEAQQELAA